MTFEKVGRRRRGTKGIYQKINCGGGSHGRLPQESRAVDNWEFQKSVPESSLIKKCSGGK